MKKAGFLQGSGSFAAVLENELPRGMMTAALSFGAGFAASRAIVFGSLAPFGMAAVAAADRHFAVFVLLGAACGTLLPGGPAYPARYLAAMAAVLVFRFLCAGFEKKQTRPLFPPLCAGCAAALTGGAVVLANGLLVRDALLCFAETVLCACGAFFLERAAPLFLHPAKFRSMGRRDAAAALIAFCVLLVAMEPLAVRDVSAGRILGLLLILTAARFGGAPAGCVTGSSIGLMLGLGSASLAPILAAYAFAGLMAGVFSPLGRFADTLALILAGSAAGFELGSHALLAGAVTEMTIASVIFVLLPERFISRFSPLFSTAAEPSVSPTAARVRLLSAAEGLRDAAGLVTRVGEQLENHQPDDTLRRVFDDISERICKTCGMGHYCWQTAHSDTMDAFDHIGSALEACGTAERKDMPPHFSTRCCRLGELLAEGNRSYAGYTAHQAAGKQVGSLRRTLSGQWRMIAGFLSELEKSAADMQTALAPQPVCAALAACGLPSAKVDCRLDKDGHLAVEAKIPSSCGTSANRTELLAELSAACGKRLVGPSIFPSGSGTILRFRQKTQFQIEHGQCSIRKDGEKFCGDAADAFLDDDRAVLLLSDGMGAGGRAAVDANLTIELTSRLLRAGFDFPAIFEAVNAALMLKSADETFATLDTASIDLFSGETQLYKAGAPPTYLRRHGRAERIVQNSLPAGILPDIAPSHGCTRLGAGDLIVLVSDGAVAGGDSWLLKAIAQYGGGPVNLFARDLAQMARHRRADGHGDDITVLAAHLEEA